MPPNLILFIKAPTVSTCLEPSSTRQNMSSRLRTVYGRNKFHCSQDQKKRNPHTYPQVTLDSLSNPRLYALRLRTALVNHEHRVTTCTEIFSTTCDASDSVERFHYGPQALYCNAGAWTASNIIVFRYSWLYSYIHSVNSTAPTPV